MSSKYYLAHNAGSRLIGEQKFEVVDIFAGTAIGVFEATTEAQQKALDAAVKDPSSAVESITEAKYNDYRKKKAPSFSNFQHSHSQAKPQQTAIKEVAAVVVEEAAPEAPTDAAKVETVQNALGNVGKVVAPPQVEEPAKKPKK